MVTQNGRGSGFEPGWGREFFKAKKVNFWKKGLSWSYNCERADFGCQEFQSVVVITFAQHAKGPRFELGWNYDIY